MTYKCDLFYVIPVAMKHSMSVKKKDLLSHPGVAVALTTSSSKKKHEDYKFLAGIFSKFVAGKPMVCWTDGELTIKKVFEKFPIEDVASVKQSVHLRCFTHVESDMEKFLSEKTSLDRKSRNKVTADILEKELNTIMYK